MRQNKLKKNGLSAIVSMVLVTILITSCGEKRGGAVNKAGAKKEGGHVSSSLTQPIQFLPAKKKDDDWSAWNLDWLELQGMEFLRRNARKLLKNYKLAKGIIDKKDYIVEEDNDRGAAEELVTAAVSSPRSTNTVDEEEDDALSYFAQLAQE